MCLAVPGRVIDVRPESAAVDFQGNRQRVDLTLTPTAAVGTWVLVHAGFAITTMSEQEALQTWDYLRGDDGALAELELDEESGDACV